MAVSGAWLEKLPRGGLFGLNHMHGCSLPVPGLDRLTEIVVTEALRLMVADFSPEFVARADRSLAAYDQAPQPEQY